jgi:hypothetical protein
VTVAGMGPKNMFFFCFSTAFKRRRWEVGKDTSAALELLYIGNLKGFSGVRIIGPRCYTRRSRKPQKHELLQKAVALYHCVRLAKPAALGPNS